MEKTVSCQYKGDWMKLRAAVIGVGAMGRNHARIYADFPTVELVGIADYDEARAQDVAKRYGGKAYTDYRQLLDEQNPHLVTIAVPTVDHLNTALEVTQRGIHLLIEKPIAFTVAEGLEIVAAAEHAGVKLMIGHIERFNPAVQELKMRLDKGELGRVFQIDARRQGPFPARIRDVGVVIDLAVHDVDITRYLSGSEVKRVFAETESNVHSRYEDLLIGSLRLNNGIVASLTVNWLTPTKIRELYVTGEGGMLYVNYLTQDLYFYENSSAQGTEWESLRVLRGVSEGRMVRYVVNKKEPLYTEIESFVKAVQGDAPLPLSGLDGLKALAIAQALVVSGNENRIVTLEDILHVD
jgi:UDP-N-acetylglucosamine 3-dehydrogenase